MKRNHCFLVALLFALWVPARAQTCVQLAQGATPPYVLGLKCNFTASSAPFGAFNTHGITYWQVVFVPFGTVSAASLSFDSSTTGLGGSWTTGGILSSATIGSMTSSGSYGPNSSPTTPSNYGQLTPTITGSGTVTVVLYGYTTSPGGSGGGSDPRTSTQILPANWTGAIPLGPGSGTIAFSTAATGVIQTGNCSSAQSMPIVINAGSTVIAAVSSMGNPHQYLVWDDAGNIYHEIIPEDFSQIELTALWATSPSSTLAATHIFVILADGTVNGCIATAATYTGVVGFGRTVSAINAGSTSVTESLTTQDPGNFSVCGIQWLTAANALTFTTGTSRSNSPPASGFDGIAIGDNTSAGPASVTVAGTLGSSAFWGEECVELRSSPGAMGQWGIRGPNNQSSLATTNIPGAGAEVLTLQTGTVTGSSADVFNPPNMIPMNQYSNTPFDLLWRAQIPNTTTGEWFCGLSDVGTGPGEFNQNFGGFCYNPPKSDATWNICTRAGAGAINRTASALSAIDSGWHDLRIRNTPSTPGSWDFWVDGNGPTTYNTNLPVAPLGLGCSVITRTGASRSFNLIPPYSIISVTK